MYHESPPAWTRQPGARCRAIEHLTRLEHLQEFEAFAGLEEDFIQALAGVASGMEVGAGTAIYREGEPSGSAYLLARGRVKLHRTSRKGRDQIQGVQGDGSVLGLATSLAGEPRSHGAGALTTCELYVVFHNDLLDLMQRFPKAALRLSQLLAKESRELEELVSGLVFHSAPQRVARMLLNLATEEGRVTKQGVVFEPSLSRQEMSEATGISREALSRTLSRLAQEGILELEGKSVTILQPTELRLKTGDV